MSPARRLRRRMPSPLPTSAEGLPAEFVAIGPLPEHAPAYARR